MTALNDDENPLYLRMYQYFRDLILSGKLQKDAKLPSVRSCAEQLQVSRTTVETAYQLLAADGYVISKPQSGYYVSDIPEEGKKLLYQNSAAAQAHSAAAVSPETELLYDFSARAVDRESFDFNIWRRYIKSALRQDARMLSYGESQGEWELRCCLAEYAARSRNVHCRPEDIVVGAGTQSLLQILCPLLKDRDTVSFPTPSFRQGIQIFEDYGHEIHFRDKNADVIYVSPSHMNRFGEVMSVSRRLELLRHAGRNHSLIIEDDFESEFQYQNQPIPSLQSLSGAKGVVYLGTFSRLLLPSIRLSYMVLPEELAGVYREKAHRYNQTASKAEQIALCQFIRDGHLEQQIRKLRKLYSTKTRQLYAVLEGQLRERLAGGGLWLEEGNLCIVLTIEEKEAQTNPESGSFASADAACSRWMQEARKHGVLFDSMLRAPDGTKKVVLSSQGIPTEQMEMACQKAICVLEEIGMLQGR